MKPDIDNSRPLLSLCIPTFNRAESLSALFASLEPVFEQDAHRVEICVSNNCSTDNTPAVVEQWREKLNLSVLTQERNIGATANVHALAKMARGKWILFSGDDDLVDQKELATLLDRLQESTSDEWILLNIVDIYCSGRLTKWARKPAPIRAQNKKILIDEGITHLGFLGTHVMPESVKHQFRGADAESTKPWPHLSVFLSHILRGGTVTSATTSVIKQDGSGRVLYWQPGDWVLMRIRIIDVVVSLLQDLPDERAFCYRLALSELYQRRNLVALAVWKLCDPVDFSSRARKVFASRYSKLSYFQWFTIPHAILLFCLKFLPVALYRATIRVIGYGEIYDTYIEKREAMSQFDGVKRGI